MSPLHATRSRRTFEFRALFIKYQLNMGREMILCRNASENRLRLTLKEDSGHVDTRWTAGGLVDTDTIQSHSPLGEGW